MPLDRLLLTLGEAVDADDHALAGLDLLLPAERRLLDLRLHEALLDRGDGAAELVDLQDQLPGLRLELVREGFDEVRAAERVAVSVPPASCASNCCVRNVIRAARSDGKASASS